MTKFDRGATLMRGIRGRLAIAFALAIALVAVFATPAFAAFVHPAELGTYGKEGSDGSGKPVGGLGDGCSIAYQSAEHRLYLFSEGQIFGLNRSAPGTASPLPGPGFPIAANIYAECGDRDMGVDNSSGASKGRIYAVPSSTQIFGWDPSGNPLPTPWPVGVGGETCGVAVTAGGEVWGGSYGLDSVTKFNTDGSPAGEKPVPFKSCKLAVDPTNNDLFSLSYGGGTLMKYTAASGYADSVELTTVGYGDSGLAVNGSRNRIYVANAGTEVKAYDTDTGEVVETIETGESARDIAVDEATDTLFITLGSYESGYISEWPGVVVPDATVGENTGYATAHGHLDPAGAGPITACRFEYSTAPDFPAGPETVSKPCSPTIPPSYAGPQDVEADLGTPTAEVPHYLRLIVSNANGTNVTPSRTFTPHHVVGLRTDPASAIDRNGATLNGSYLGNGEDTEYFFKWGLDATYGHETPLEDKGITNGPTSISATLTGMLEPDTVYHFRVVAKNGEGTSEGEDEAFKTLPAVSGLKTEAATDVKPTAADLNASFTGDGLDTTYFFEWGGSVSYGNDTPELAVTAPSGPTAIPATTITDLEPLHTYHYRIVAKNSIGTTYGEDMTVTTVSTPTVLAQNSSDVTANSATLHAVINPHGADTTYRFEYGTTPEYGNSAPAGDGSIPTGETAVPVEVELTGLSGDAVYHFRVVATSKYGTVTSSDQTFNFLPQNCPNALVRQQTGGEYLPDCRAYELVSPGDAGNVILVVGVVTSPASYADNPARFEYAGLAGGVKGTDPVNGATADIYLATRTSGGWVTTLPGQQGNEISGLEGPNGSVADRTLSHFLDFRGWTGDELPHVWAADGSSLGRWPATAPLIPGSATSHGWFQPSPNFTDMAFSSNNVAWTPEGLTTPPGSAYDYDVATGTTTLISRLPSGGPIAQVAPVVKGQNSFPDEAISFPGSMTDNTESRADRPKEPAKTNQGISLDGSRILMSVANGSYHVQWPEFPGFHLYMRDVDAGLSYDVSRSDNVRYVGMTSDASKVFFQTADPITTDDHDSSVDLFMWSLSSDTITRISKSNGGTAGDTDLCSPSWTSQCDATAVRLDGQVTDTAIASQAGDVYFYSPEQLDAAKGVPGARNIYVYREGKVRFVGIGYAPRMNVSPDGDHMALISDARLTDFDNKGFEEMYSYDATTRTIICVSCSPTGAAPTSDVQGSHNGLFMSNDGRTFFYTSNPLVPKDTNKLNDVYEYADGRPQLITSGTGSHDVTLNIGGEVRTQGGLASVSADGTNVYFATYETLVPFDENGEFPKFYDARSGGGFAIDSPRQPCVAADECHGVPTSVPSPLGVVSDSNLGSSGNVRTAGSHKKKKWKKAHKKRGSERNHGRTGGRRHG